ncbi:MAG: hypothetical protein ACRD3S_04020, partial [Terracidiphilus sp.]
MQIDPVEEWQRLATAYREKSPEELLELARDFADLTATAQQALRIEMQSRGMGDQENPKLAPELQSAPKNHLPLTLRNAPADPVNDNSFGAFGTRAPQLVADAPDAGNEDEAPHEYTWKTPLADCNTREETMYLREALRRAGIESWINVDGSTTSYVPSMEQRLTVG